MSKLYKNSGVDVVKTDQLIVQALKFIKSSHNKNVLGNKLGFSAEYKINKDITLCSATDGVGTKAILAAELGIYEGIGQDLVGMCSNDLLCNKAKPLFFLDYFACSSVIPKQYTEILKSITRACKKIQCALIGGETAEMPDLYSENDFDLAGFAVGALERGNNLPTNINNNDLLVGLPSSGFHSNGYSLIRKVIKNENLKWDSPNPINKNSLIKEELLIPTKIYQKILSPLVTNKIISGLSHITGGGITENLPRILPKNLSFKINLDKWEMPRLMSWIIKKSEMSEAEALKTFNCGIGMICVVSKNNIQTFIDYFKNKNEDFYLIGEITNAKSHSYMGNLF